MNTKGLSTIVIMVLFILLAIIAIGLLWFFLRPFLVEGLGNQEGVQACYTLSIEPVSCEYANYIGEGYPHAESWPVVITIKRNPGDGNFSSVRLVVTNTEGTTQSYREQDLRLEQLEQQRFIAYIPGTETAKPQKVETLVYLTSERACPITGGSVGCMPYHVPLKCAEYSCDANETESNIIDFGDYLEFVNLLDNQNGTSCTDIVTCPRTCADFDGDGIVRSDARGFGDYFEFMHSLEQDPPIPC